MVDHDLRRHARAGARGLLLLAACLWGACSEALPPPTVVYEGAPTDEALERMLALPKEQGAPLTVLSPAAGGVLHAAVPPTVTFVEGAARLAPRRGPGEASWLVEAVLALDVWLGIEPALAHGTPYNGTAYLLHFTDAQGHLRLRVFTDQMIVTVPDAEWSALAQLSGAVTLTIDSATFEENNVVAGGGPFERARVAFTIE